MSTPTLIDGFTPSGRHVVVRGGLRHDEGGLHGLTVEIDGRSVEITGRLMYRDGGSYELHTPFGRIWDGREAIPRDPSRHPRLGDEQILLRPNTRWTERAD